MLVLILSLLSSTTNTVSEKVSPAEVLQSAVESRAVDGQCHMEMEQSM